MPSTRRTKRRKNINKSNNNDNVSTRVPSVDATTVVDVPSTRRRTKRRNNNNDSNNVSTPSLPSVDPAVDSVDNNNENNNNDNNNKNNKHTKPTPSVDTTTSNDVSSTGNSKKTRRHLCCCNWGKCAEFQHILKNNDPNHVLVGMYKCKGKLDSDSARLFRNNICHHLKYKPKKNEDLYVAHHHWHPDLIMKNKAEKRYFSTSLDYEEATLYGIKRNDRKNQVKKKKKNTNDHVYKYIQSPSRSLEEVSSYIDSLSSSRGNGFSKRKHMCKANEGNDYVCSSAAGNDGGTTGNDYVCSSTSSTSGNDGGTTSNDYVCSSTAGNDGGATGNDYVCSSTSSTSGNDGGTTSHDYVCSSTAGNDSGSANSGSGNTFSETPGAALGNEELQAALNPAHEEDDNNTNIVMSSSMIKDKIAKMYASKTRQEFISNSTILTACRVLYHVHEDREPIVLDQNTKLQFCLKANCHNFFLTYQ